MSSRKQDLLGLLIDTALQPADDDPMFDGYGNTGLLVPADGNIADDTEEDDAFEALREDLSPGEASEVAETMRPLSEEEQMILETTPGLKGLTRVDDAEHEDWMIENSRRGYTALDPILDDAIYGDSDLGWGFHIPGVSSLKKLGRGAYRGVRRTVAMPVNLAMRAPGIALRAPGMAYGTARGALGIIPGFRPGGQQDPGDQSDPSSQDPNAQPYPSDPATDDTYASQGDSHMNQREEAMERLGLDSDSGWGFHIPGVSSLKKLGRGAYKYGKKGVFTPINLAKRAAMKFVPNRDAAKARLVKNLHKKLWVEHANWLAIQDQKAGLPLQPQKYAMVSKLWATSKIKQGGLPTKFTVSAGDVLGNDILGNDLMGAWWNPFSWFSEKSQIIVNQTQGERAPVGPDGQPLPQGVSPDGMDPNAVPPPAEDPNAAPVAEDAAEGDTDMTTGIAGEDSLGAFATEILSGVATQDPAIASAKANQFLTLIVYKLKSGKPLSPREVAQISTLAKTGNPKATKIYSVLLKAGAAMAGDDSGAWLYKLNPAYWLKSKDERRLIDMERGMWEENAKLQKQLSRKGVVIEQAQRAKAASLAVAQAKAETDASEAQLKQIEAAIMGDDSGAWAHMLNPTYWFKSSEEKKLTDIEKAKWIENAKLQKDLAKRQEVLDQANKAKAASEAVAQAKAQAAATEAQLKEIEASISGELIRDLNADVNGSFVGHEKPTAVTKVVLDALDKTGKRAAAKALYAKISKGEPLSPEELKEARGIARLLNRVKVVHGDLITGSGDLTSVLHGAFVGACILGGISAARERNAKLGRAADHLANRCASGEALTPVEKKATAKLITETEKLRNFTKAHVSGTVFVGHDKAAKLRKVSFLGAAKVMSEADKKMLGDIMKLAKAGNPRAVKALEALKKSGDIMGGDFIGLSLSSAFKYATAPVWLPAYGAYKGVKWTGKKIFGGSGKGATPEQVRLAKLRAARQRAIAAQAKARAADAQTEAELRAQEAIASAAEAEAQAADAEALSKEAAMRTAEVEANPDMANPGQSDDGDTAGEFVGGWTELLGKDTKEAKIVKKAGEKSATGMKIRAGAKMAAKIKAGDPKSRAALKTMIEKSNKGDKQAKRDLNAVWAGRQANLAKEKAQKKQIALAARKAQKLKVIAAQRKVEARIATKLARTERRVQLSHYAKVEAKAAKGHKPSIAYVKKQVVASKKGDSKATARVNAMKLGRTVRLASPTKRERRNLAVAARVVDRARRNDPKAIRQIALHKAAAKQGNPNAKRAMKRYEVMAPVVAAVATGVIVGSKSKKKANKKHNDQVAAVTKAKKDLAAGKGTREEFAAGARAAQALGDKATAGELAVAAANAPSATERLKKTATVVAAKEAGNPEARAAIAESFEKAKTGDPEAIKRTANVVAVQTIDDINKGKPVSPAMTDAINLHERIAAGDQAAIEQAKAITAEATKPNPIPEATAAAVTLAAATITTNALASKPKAKAEFLAKVNPPLGAAEKGSAEAEVSTILAKAKAGTVTPEEGERGVRLAERLGQPRLAAQISSMSPPLDYSDPRSTLPDMPLAPITSFGQFLKESLKAITFSTRDPLGNYRGGIAARSKEQSPVEPVSSSGWSPFAYFKSASPWIAPIASATAAAASITNLISSKQHKAAPAPSPAPTPAAAPSVAPAPVVETVTQTPSDAALTAQPAATAQGEATPEYSAKQDELFALLNKRAEGSFTEADRQHALKIAKELKLPLVTAKLEASKPTTSKGDDEGILPPDEKLSAKQLVQHALNNKTMSRNDFNKVAAGKPQNAEKLLAFLSSKGVKVSGAFVGDEPEDLTTKKAQVAEMLKRRQHAQTSKDTSGADKKTFKEIIATALKSKTMTKSDFNAAMEHHLGKKASKESKAASGEKVLKFLEAKGVKITG